jgi:hypothetical protein
MPAQPSPQRTAKGRQRMPDEEARESAARERRQIDSEQVARRAYERFEARGGEHGRDQEDWFGAEEELRGTRGE